MLPPYIDRSKHYYSQHQLGHTARSTVLRLVHGSSNSYTAAQEYFEAQKPLFEEAARNFELHPAFCDLAVPGIGWAPSFYDMVSLLYCQSSSLSVYPRLFLSWCSWFLLYHCAALLCFGRLLLRPQGWFSHVGRKLDFHGGSCAATDCCAVGGAPNEEAWEELGLTQMVLAATVTDLQRWCCH